MKNIENLLKDLQESFNLQNQLINSYKNQVIQLTKRKDEEYGANFSISKEEKELIENWKQHHMLEKHNNQQVKETIGGRWQYIFIPTNIGTVGTVKCICGDCFTFRK